MITINDLQQYVKIRIKILQKNPTCDETTKELSMLLEWIEEFDTK